MDRFGRFERFDGLGLGADGGGLTARLERWAAEARVDEAARGRSRERWLRRQAEEDGTVAGVLCDLLEAGTAVTVHTRAGRRHSGPVRAVGADFVALDDPSGAVLVALAAVASLQSGPGAGVVVGDRAAAGGPRLADVAAGLAAAGERVRVVTADGAVLAGVLRAVGRDVAVLRAEGERPAAWYVPLAAIAELVVGA